jgi:four helix bundle protein
MRSRKVRVRSNRVLGGSRRVLDAITQRAGTIRASARFMGVRNFRDLVAWQLAYELKCEVFAFTATGGAAKDFKYRDQIRDSSASAASNISEGFGRFRPLDFARFLEYARGSLVETQNHLLDGRDRGYLDAALYSRLSNLARSALTTTTHLLLSKQKQAAEQSRSRPDGIRRRTR